MVPYTIYKLHQNHLTITNIEQILSKAIKSHSYFEIFQNLISVATLIRAYLDEKIREINSRSYMFIRKCRVVKVFNSLILDIHLGTLIRGHLAVLGVKWPFSNGRDRR